MSEQEDRGPDLLTDLYTPTLLESLPPTDPRVLREIRMAELGKIHYAAIGRVASAFAIFESNIDYWLFEFAGLPPGVGICFTGQMIGPRPRIDAFISLVRHLGAKSKWNESLEILAKDATALGEQRNRAVHDVWDMSIPEKPERIEATARKTVRHLRVHVPTAELLDLEQNIIRLDERFEDMAQKLHDEIFTSPEKVP